MMPVAKTWTYFDHAAVAPLPTPTMQAIADYASQAMLDGDMQWPKWAQGVEAGRSHAASLLKCQANEIAMVPNTTFGINVVAHGMRWQPGDNMVVPANEFVSNLLAWQLLSRRGVEVRLVSGEDDSLIESLIAAIDQRTRLVAISWVHYLTGYRADLTRICDAAHAKGSRVFVDAIQGLGAFPLSVDDIPIDFLAADGHKWMLGPEGAGLLFIQRSRLEELEPIMMGWGSIEHAYRFDSNNMQLRSTAARYEGGATCMPGQLGFAKSLELLLQAHGLVDAGSLSQQILATTQLLEEGLRRIGATVYRHAAPDRQSGIVVFELPNQDSALVRSMLIDRKIVLSVRHGRLRAALHAYNNQDEVEHLLASIKAFLHK
jgi:cysteine desulfurase / selenocysteine lyase